MNDLDLYVGVSAGAAAVSLIANGVKPLRHPRNQSVRDEAYYFDHRNVFSLPLGRVSRRSGA